MKYCWDPFIKWEQEREWHFKFIWFPTIIKLEGENRKCLVWLEYVQRKSTAIDFEYWNTYPLFLFRDYVYRLNTHGDAN